MRFFLYCIVKKVFTTILFCLIAIFSFSQEKANDNQLALLYFSQGEYAKAAEIYQNLYNETHSQTHFDYLIRCYLEQGENQKAVDITKEQIRHYPKSVYYQIKLATIYVRMQQTDDANDIFGKAIKKSSKELEFCLEAGQACLDNKVDSVAQIIYENGQSKFPDNTTIAKKLSEVYLQRGENQKLIDTYITLLRHNSEELGFVESQLQYTIYERKSTQLQETLASTLSTLTEKEGKIVVFKELYLWLMIQNKDFEKAFAMSKEIDIQNDEDGERLLELGKIALSNDDYKQATNCFSYVVQKGPMGDYYEEALRNLLETSYNRLFKTYTTIDKNQVVALETEYQKALDELGESKSSGEILKNLAHIRAFYLDKGESAISMLQNAIQSPNYEYYKESLEMELADVYLFTNDIWSANMLYASIALNYKNNDLGHTAQLQQAKIAYYNGNFSYAQALLDVLKGSTSKLIANDAFELSQLISDNTALDTSTAALEIFARGDLLLLQNKNAQALATYDSIPKLYPGHSLEDDILMRKATIAKSTNDTTAMIQYLQEIADRFSYEIYADKAIFSLAEYYNKIGNFEKAKEQYKKLVLNYSNSFYAPTARKRYRELEQ